MNIITELKLKDYVTFANICSGLLSMFFSINGQFKIAALLLILAAVFDFLDGRVARYFHQSNVLGKELDSFADIISFGVAPIIFAYAQGLQSIIAMIVLLFFVLCGVLRLIRFNITKIKNFEGIPITHSAIYGLLYFFVPFNNYILILYALSGLLMISTFKVKKVR